MTTNSSSVRKPGSLDGLFEHQKRMIETAEAMAECPLCHLPIPTPDGAVVYHWDCLYDSLKEVRERCADTSTLHRSEQS